MFVCHEKDTFLIFIYFSVKQHSLSTKMEQNQNRRNAKYAPALSNLLKPYRWLGIIRFNDYGEIDKKLVLYSIFINLFQIFILCFGSFRHIISYKFYNLDSVSRIPFVMEWISHSLHFMVSTTIFIRNNKFLIQMFSRTERVRLLLAEGNSELARGALKIRLLSFIIMMLSIAAAGLFVSTDFSGFVTKSLLTIGYLLNFSTYLKEETLLMYAKYLNVMLRTMNSKLRTSVVTPESVREFRFIHNELSLLTESIGEHFEPLVTTMVAATGVQTWGNCFTLIRMATSDSPNISWALSYVCNVMNHLVKLGYICKSCENVEQQVNRLISE